MNLTVNGKKTSIADKESLSISQLLDELNVSDPLYVTVELNGDIMERINFDSTLVRDGDEIEFLYFMGGGGKRMMLTEEQIERYQRHIALKEVGGKGQRKLLDGRVLIIGVGGLGAPAALYLAAVGVGTIGLVDADVVDLTNLQRQVIHFTPDIGRAKVISAKEKMEAINPGIKVNTYQEWAHTGNITGIIRDYDFVIDGTDNFAAKFLINDACVLAGIPYSHAGILRFDGQTITVMPGESACYRCIFPSPPPKDAIPTCSQAGVIGVLPGVLGLIQATEAIKFLLGKGDLLTGRLLIYNALQMSFDVIQIKKNPKCPLCGETPSIKELKDEIDAVTHCDLEKR